jgi:hypothetical protein
MKPFEYYKTVEVQYPSKDEYTNVFVYSQGKVVWQGPYVPFKEIADRFKGMLVEKVVNEEGLKEQRRAYGAEVSRLEAEFKRDLFEEHGVTGNPKAGLCFGIAWDNGHASGYSEVASYFDTHVDLNK